MSKKLHGYDFWREVLKEPQRILAPMVDQSELAWRLLSRDYGAQVTFTPMIHSSLFASDETYRRKLLETDPTDHPLIAQFCGNDPDLIFEAAKLAEPHCQAIDLNLGCPQNIAKRGRYGAFLEDPDTIFKIVNKLHLNLQHIPVTVKFRVFESEKDTCEFAKMLERAGASVLSVHGRTRDQKGPQTGLADWSKIAAIKRCVNVPVVANGNILCYEDIIKCLEATGADAVMSAQGNLYNPAVLLPPSPEQNNSTPSPPPTVCRVILEYSEYCKKYPPSMSCVRAHLFKLCFHFLQFEEFLHFRDLINDLKSIDDVIEFAHKLEETFKETNIDEMLGDMGESIRFCQARVRCKESEARTQARNSTFSREDRKRTLAEMQAINGISLKQAKKLLRDPDKKFETIKRPWKFCPCNQPMSKGCVNNMCKICCRKACKENLSFCRKHRICGPPKDNNHSQEQCDTPLTQVVAAS